MSNLSTDKQITVSGLTEKAKAFMVAEYGPAKDQEHRMVWHEKLGLLVLFCHYIVEEQSRG